MLPWHTPLDLPHIEKAITDSLTFKDLLNGILINRAWYNALIPLLYSDVITFRSSRYHRGLFDHFFDTPDSQRAILKHSHHIRALTCTFPSLSVLMKTGCPNLVELNYVLEFERPPDAIYETDPKQGLDVLDVVLARCPNLRALSFENISFATDKHVKAVLAFVKRLDRHPGITCFYMSVIDDPNDRKLSKPFQDIFEHRLGRIDRNKVTSLTMRLGKELIRSKRGLPVLQATAASGIPRQHQWAYRGTPLDREQLNLELPKTLSEDEQGRWEGEHKTQIEYPHAVAVLENDGVLELSLPQQPIMNESISMALFDRFPNLVRFSSGHVRDKSTDKFLLLAHRNKHLKHLTWNYRDRKQIFDFLRDFPRVELTQLNLRMLPGGCYETLLKPFMFSNRLGKTHYLCNSLVGLMFTVAEPLPLAHFLEIVANCPNLQSLQADHVSVAKTNDQGASPPWVCTRLRLLRVYLFLVGWNNWTGETNEAPREMGQTFMRELGDLSQLEHLEMRFVFGEMEVLQTPFLRLALGCKNGLQQLGRLRELRSLEIHDLAHNIGPRELMWMASRWPELRALTLPKFPMHTRMPFLSPCRGDGWRPTPDFSSWWPNMRAQKVRKCNNCEGCGFRQKGTLDSYEDQIAPCCYH
ncbi:hypothetical protein BGZ74_008814 [Mortierella antarctica]|nr:hypothetical protein BGZ74_008814 [Mortierella antarctica]